MSVVFHIDTPLVTIEEFARRSGMTVDAARHKVSAGEIPTIDTRLDKTRRGRVYVNMLKLAQLAEASEFKHPSMNED